jgi:class 3 adenylate cyclase/tetratricopeptide (TPR) repeat protein
MDTLLTWLQELGLERYAPVFLSNDVDLNALRLLSDADLVSLGISLGHRRVLLKAIAELDGNSPAALATPALPESAPAQQPRRADGERRQLTVLFCDMVRFTELASRLDPEELQGIVRSYEDTCAARISRYDGYVFQRLGDGIVAFFGYPLAHESEAERAIRAGLEIIDALAKHEVPGAGQLAVRIGIATGLVVVSSAEKGAVGETMNLASRLQTIAQPGSIVVSERVHRLAGGAFDYEDLGEQTLKGIAHPTHVYRVVGVSAAVSRFEAAHQEGLTPFVGREQEIALLRERWQLAQDGEGQVVLLSGEPGIGKSRILKTLRERLEHQGAQALRFQCSPYYVNSAFWPSIDNFERALTFGRDESPESKLDKLEALMVTHYGRPLADVRFIASMLSVPCEQRYGALPMTPQKLKDETLRSLVDLTEAAARKQPSLMLFEDAHWADPTTLEVLDLLIDRISAIPLLVVLTHRPEFQSRWSQYGHVTALNLSKLTRAQSSAMVSKLTGGKALPDELLEQILVRTDGVPLFVEELTKSILESGALKASGDRYDYSGATQTITIPVTLRDSLMARLDRVVPGKEVAQIGAAIGREFSYELIAAVAPLTKAQLDDGLERLTESGLAVRHGTPPDATYSFKHALVQDAAYDSLLKSRRQELHGAIAQAIEARFPNLKNTEPEVLAHHLTAAGQTGTAFPLWQKAGVLALKRGALTEAISHLNRGLELISTLPQSSERDAGELRLRIVLGTAWLTLRGWPAPEVWTTLHPALALAKLHGDPERLLGVLEGLWTNTLTQGRVAESLDWVKELFGSAETTGHSDLIIFAHAAAAVTHFSLGEFIAAREHGERVLALYDQEKHRRLAIDPKTTVGVWAGHWTWMLGHPDQAVRISDATTAHARRVGYPLALGWALTLGAEAFDFRCEPEELRKRARECERLGHENSLPVLWGIMAPIAYGWALIHEGRAAEGMPPLKAGIAGWEASGGRLLCPYWKSVLAEGMAHLGEVDDALQLINEQIGQVERWGERAHYAEILRLKGWMLSLRGDLEGAEKNYLASLGWAHHQQAKSWELRTSTSLARLWHGQGRGKEAYELLSPVYAWFTEGFDTNDLIEAKTLLGELADLNEIGAARTA